MTTEVKEAEQPTELEDPLIDEIRAIRRKLSEAAGNDPARLAEMANRAAERLKESETGTDAK